ncbi:TPA: ferrous iron transport protein B, partial [Candidatus Poribacteria bacterium]|nr:ferrous iron transport protein B [Candidatus Poribacteria bacterium]
EIFGTDVESAIVDRRYGFISGAGTEVIHHTAEIRHTRSDKIDKIVTNRVLGIPIFLVAMWFVFQMTANVSGAYLDWVDGVIGGPITHWIVRILGAIKLSGTWFESLFVDGIIAGVGGVLVFVPVLFFLYFFIALLEDSGYMARAAFVMDRLMHALGLHGKSFIPLLIGFGCSVPGIYATRTMENEKDRVLTGLLVPMMSCAARLPVYVIFAAAFFPKNSGWVIFAMYMLGIVAAIGSGMLFKRTLFRGKEEAAFVMELPPYRLPTFKGILIHMWERTYVFVRKAWTIILAASVIVWFLTNIPWGVENKADSLFGKVSKGIAPVFTPAGYGGWQATGALVTGFVAKEVVVSTMSEIYAVAGAEEEEETPTFIEDVREIFISFASATVDTVKMTVSLIPGVDLMGEEEEEEDTGLVKALGNAFNPLSAVSFMVFVLLYVPCMVAIAALRHEYGTKWMLFSAGYLMVLAWVVSVIVYQGGRLFGLG